MSYEKTEKLKPILSLIILIFITNFSYSNVSVKSESTRRLKPQKSSFVIDGELIKLKNGVSEIRIDKSSASKIVTKYTGINAKGDLNNDSLVDMAVILTQETGGSGTFYYVAVISSKNKRYYGSNAIFLGDRIKVNRVEVKNGEVVVNYWDRKKSESMVEEPTVATSKTFAFVNDELKAKNSTTVLVGEKWIWEKTIMNNGDVTTPKNVEAFSLIFKEDGKISITTDCNSYKGSYEIVNNKLLLGPLLSTRMHCEDSQEDIFINFINAVDSLLISDGQKLILMLKFDSGSLIFN